MILHIDLQEGFHQANVEVFVNGNKQLANPNINTRLQTGLAESIEVEVSPGPLQVELKLLDKKLYKKVELEREHDIYIGFSISRDGEIKYAVSEIPFRYM